MASKEHDKILQIFEKEDVGLLGSKVAVERLRKYEAERHEQLKSFGLATDDDPYRFSRRTIRAWDRVQEAWKKKPDSSEADRLAVLAELQTKLSGKFGDPDLFRWLAKEENKGLWSGSEVVAKVAHLNTVEKELKRRSPNATFTPPDAVHHPRWLMYEPKNGSNLRNYELHSNGYEVTLDVPLLQKKPAGLEEINQVFTLCPSSQFSHPRFEGTDKVVRVSYQTAGQDFIADLKSSEVLFSRQYLENRNDEQLLEGDIGSVWLKVVLDIDYKAPKDWLDARGKIARSGAVEHFKTSLATNSKFEKEVVSGTRVLSIDLGLRSFAACSVFELVDEKPKQLCFSIHGKPNLWAKHERSFLLELPGESSPTTEVEDARATASKELRRIKQEINKLKSISRLVLSQTPEDRLAAINDIELEFLAPDEASTFDQCFQEQIRSLKLCTDVETDNWAKCIKESFTVIEELLGKEISQWRKATRRKVTEYGATRLGRDYQGGKSAWAIEYLTNVRRTLQAWSLHGRRSGEIRRADRGSQGTFAARLLDHINALKEDRIKVGSDLIVQAARGFVRGIGDRWEQRFKPVRFIFMEDLARYRFKVDRPRRENSQLMRWAHREIRRQVEMQAEIYGILVGDTGAGFTSRFYAKNHAPGCRCQVLTVKDMKSPVFLQRLIEEGIADTIESLKPGMRIVRDGGPDFITLDRDRKPIVIHADINASQNLQRRFWTRHGDPYRLTAIKVNVNGRDAYYCDSTGKRLTGALEEAYGSKYICLMLAADGNGFVVENLKKAQWQRVVGQNAVDDEESSSEDELGLEFHDDFAEVQKEGGRETFFRDPSGRLLNPNRWFLSKEYWGRVKSQIAASLKRQ